MAEIRVGIAGWTYPPWRGNFYPAGMAQKHELAYASRRLGMLEINGTFYSLQRPPSFAAWYDATPAGFVFSLKGNKFVTHIKRLKEAREPVASFLGSGVLRLAEKLGPILWQLPPNMAFDEERVREFVALLPRDTGAAAKFARDHAKLDGDRMWVEVDEKRPLRHAIEFRNESFRNERFVDILREHNVAMVVADKDSLFPSGEDLTADWVYVRLHGERTPPRPESGYTPEEIAAWAEKIRVYAGGGEPKDARRIGRAAAAVKGGRDVFVAFDNTEIKERSPVNAREMAEALGVGPRESVSEVVEAIGATVKVGAPNASAAPGAKPMPKGVKNKAFPATQKLAKKVANKAPAKGAKKAATKRGSR